MQANSQIKDRSPPLNDVMGLFRKTTPFIQSRDLMPLLQPLPICVYLCVYDFFFL